MLLFVFSLSPHTTRSIKKYEKMLLQCWLKIFAVWWTCFSASKKFDISTRKDPRLKWIKTLFHPPLHFFTQVILSCMKKSCNMSETSAIFGFIFCCDISSSLSFKVFLQMKKQQKVYLGFLWIEISFSCAFDKHYPDILVFMKNLRVVSSKFSEFSVPRKYIWTSLN